MRSSAAIVLWTCGVASHVACAQVTLTAPPSESLSATTPPSVATDGKGVDDKSLPKTMTVKIPAAAYDVTLTLIPGDATKGIKPFYLGTTELTWQAFDPYLYRLDEGGTNDALPANADTTTRPSKPYLPPDRGFGHDGYAAITMSFKNARAYCAWLSKHDAAAGRRTFRLPTEDEWLHAALAGEARQPDDKMLQEMGWFAPGADGKTHAVASKKPNAWGLYDMFGNAAEWVIFRDSSGKEKGGLKGGSYLDDPGAKDILKTVPNNADWNASDPQIPKSPWWLADGPFVSFRIACDVPAEAGKSAPKPSPNPGGQQTKPVINSQ